MVGQRKLRANWQDAIGIPRHDAGGWMLRDTPVPRGMLSLLRPRVPGGRGGDVRYVKNPAGGLMTHVMATKTKPEVAQIRYETNGRNFDASVLGTLADAAPDPIDADVVDAFAADPNADLYVVEVCPVEAVTNDVQRATEELGLHVQLIGIGEEEPDGYPGEFIETDPETLTNPSSALMRAIPAADLLVMSTGIRFAGVSSRVIENSKPRAASVNPVEGDVFAAIEGELLLTNEEDGGLPDGQMKLARWGGSPGDEDQLSLRSAFARV